MGAELFQEDGRTNKTKLIVAFRNFAKASNERCSKDGGKTAEGRQWGRTKYISASRDKYNTRPAWGHVILLCKPHVRK